VDINPHRSGPKWPWYVLLVILLVVKVGIVAAVLVRG
jgi:hypothetical protein